MEMRSERDFKIENYMRIAKTTADDGLREEMLTKVLRLLEEQNYSDNDPVQDKISEFIELNYFISFEKNHNISKVELEDRLSVFLLKNRMGYVKRTLYKEYLEILGIPLIKNSNYYYRGIVDKNKEISDYELAHTNLMNDIENYINENGEDIYIFKKNGSYYVQDIDFIKASTVENGEVLNILREWRKKGVLVTEYGRLQKTIRIVIDETNTRKKYYVINEIYPN